MAKSRDPGLDNKLFSSTEHLPVLSNNLPFFLPVDSAPELFFQVSRLQQQNLNLCFKFAEVENIAGHGMMQVWITGYCGFLCEAIELFVDKTELYFCFGQQISIFQVEALSWSCTKDKVTT